jgi:hypothetical protein
MTVTAIKISNFDSSSVFASVSRSGENNYLDPHFEEGATYVAIPQELINKGIKKAVIVRCKSESVISLTFNNGEKLLIRKISEDENPQIAIQEALEDLALEGLDPDNLASWIAK